MIKEYNIRLNIASDIENVLHASDAGSKILWELKRNHFEASRITLLLQLFLQMLINKD